MSSSAGVCGAAAADGFLTHQPGGDRQMSRGIMDAGCADSAGGDIYLFYFFW